MTALKRNGFVRVGLTLWLLLMGAVAFGTTDGPIVLVPPFENLSSVKRMVEYQVATGHDPDQPQRSFVVDRFSEGLRGFLEDILLSMGATMVERQRVDAILLETEFGRLSGLVDTEQAIELGKMLGATTIVMGTIQDVHESQRNFSGYGISSSINQLIGTVRIRLIDIASGQVVYSRMVEGSAMTHSSRAGTTQNEDAVFQVLRAALETLRTDEILRRHLLALE
ncbi:CsgG/HfaB family protein [Methylocaldum sp. 14B]|uniref:CsgG/HfaB family protein n=1 Tax=Methylocaldum sp. 14B TaxID=1912213 RepID=UPI00098A2727|nr:CsgG/HfaB family protein [Methylocaldum sp. 14B]